MKQAIQARLKAMNENRVAAQAAVGAAVVTLSTQASAVLDPNIATGLTALKTDFDALMAVVYPIAIAITSALVIFGLVKMFIHKAVK